MVFEAVVVLLIIVNVLCFLLSTERSLDDNKTAQLIFDVVELCTVRTRPHSVPWFPLHALLECHYDGRHRVSDCRRQCRR